MKPQQDEYLPPRHMTTTSTKLKKSKSLPRQPFLFHRSKSDGGGDDGGNGRSSLPSPLSPPKISPLHPISSGGQLPKVHSRTTTTGTNTTTSTTKSPRSSFLAGWTLLTPPTQLLRNRQAARRASSATGTTTSEGKSHGHSSFQPRPTSHTSNATTTATSKSTRRPWTKSVLTQLLLRLEENLKEYCDCLACGQIASASLLLDTSEATLMTPTSSNASSPASHTLSPTKNSTTSTSTMSSPTRTTMFVNPNSSIRSSTTTSTSTSNAALSLSWRPGGGNHPSTTTTATSTASSSSSPLGKLSPSIVALEAEWERYVSPLLCLAGAEAMYGQLEHVLLADLHMKVVLKQLYQRIHQELRSVQADLCDPFIGGTTTTTKTGTTTTGSKEDPTDTPSVAAAPFTTATQAALSLSTSIQTLLHFVSIRQKLVQFHIDMFVVPPHKHHHHGHEFVQILQHKLQVIQESYEETYGSSTATTPTAAESENGGGGSSCTLALMTSLKHELKATQAVLSAVYELDHCRFMNTIRHTQILKNYRTSPPSSVLQVWLQLTLEHVLSVMPIYFDRIDAYSKPLYGFEKSRMMVVDSSFTKNTATTTNELQQQQVVGVVHDYDAFMVDFLRRHEQKGGQSMAISIVLDAKRTGNLHVEQGVVATATPTTTTPTTTKNQEGSTLPSSSSSPPPLNQELVEWPAIYMRTTLHSTSSSSHTSSITRSPLSRSPSHSSSSSARHTGGVTKTSISSMMNKLGHNSRHMLKVPSARHVGDDGGSSTRTADHHGGSSSGRMKSDSNLIRSWSNDNSPTSGSRSTTRKSSSGSAEGSTTRTTTTLSSKRRDHLHTVLEYAPDSGNLSWPHDEWSTLVPLLLQERTATDHARRPPHAVEDTTKSLLSNQPDTTTMDGSASLASMTPSTATTTKTTPPPPQAVTYQGVQDSPSKKKNHAGSHPSSPQRQGGNHTNNDNHNDSSPATVSLPHSSTYHVTRLGEYMWIVVLVKREDGSKWHQRKRSRGHSDDEIRSFVEGIASKLRFETTIFGMESVQKAQLCSSKASKHICTTDLAKYCTLSSDNHSLLEEDDDDHDHDEENDGNDDDDSYWTDTDIDNFIIGMKDSFGLQPESRMRRALKGTRGWQTGGGGMQTSKFQSSFSRLRRRGWNNRPTTHSLDYEEEEDDYYLESALAFFLGPELRKTLEGG